MNKKIMVYPEGGEAKEADLIMAFEIVESGNKYVVYTFNEKLENEMIKLYVAGFQNNEAGEPVAKMIDNNEEWGKVKEILREIIKGGNA